MTTEYMTAVQSFLNPNEGVPGNYYVGANDTLVGEAGGFAVAALFMINTPLGGGPAQTIWANRDVAGNGWELRADVTTGAVTFEVGTDMSAGSVTAGPQAANWVNVPVLVLGIMDGVNIQILVNQAVPAVVQAMGAAVYAPAVGTAPTVGIQNSAVPTQAGLDLAVAGVAYGGSAFLAALQGPGLSAYLSSRQANNLWLPRELDPAFDWDNRWTAKDGNYQPDAAGVGVDPWTPEAGAQNLTRSGLPTVRGFKNLDWHGNWAQTTPVDPAAP